jgi:hypothetical protein
MTNKLNDLGVNKLNDLGVINKALFLPLSQKSTHGTSCSGLSAIF